MTLLPVKTVEVRFTEEEISRAASGERFCLVRPVRPSPRPVECLGVAGWEWRCRRGGSEFVRFSTNPKSFSRQISPLCPYGRPGWRVRDESAGLFEIVWVKAKLVSGQWFWNVRVKPCDGGRHGV